MDSKMSTDHFESVLALAIQGAKQVYEVLKEEVRHFELSLRDFAFSLRMPSRAFCLRCGIGHDVGFMCLCFTRSLHTLNRYCKFEALYNHESLKRVPVDRWPRRAAPSDGRDQRSRTLVFLEVRRLQVLVIQYWSTVGMQMSYKHAQIVRQRWGEARASRMATRALRRHAHQSACILGERTWRMPTCERWKGTECARLIEAAGAQTTQRDLVMRERGGFGDFRCR